MAKKRRQRNKNTYVAPSNKSDYSTVVDSYMAASNDKKADLGLSSVVTDSFRNPVARTGLGTQNLLNGTEYVRKNITNNRYLLNNLYMDNWVCKSIIDLIPEDITKTWFKVSGSMTTDEITKINQYQENIDLKESILKGLKWGRLYGGALGLILLSGQNDLSKPLDYTKIMPDSFKGLYVIDRYSGVYAQLDKVVTDMSSPQFGLPEYYTIKDNLGVSPEITVHYTWLIKFTGDEPPRSEYVYEQYWGLSVIESVFEELVKRDNVSHNMVSLTFKALLSILQSQDYDMLMATGNKQAQQRVIQVAQAQSILESNLGVRLMGKEDKYYQTSYGFTGLKDIYDAVEQDIAAATGIPATKLFGKTPSGLNATGKADLQMYDDKLNVVRSTILKPIIKKLLPIITMSAIGRVPNDLSFMFDAIRIPDELEQATIAQKKVAAAIDVYERDGVSLGGFRNELRSMSDITGMFDTITDEDIESGSKTFYSDMSAMNDPIAGISSLSRSQLSGEDEPEDTRPRENYGDGK